MECKGYIVNIGKAAKLSNLTVKTVRYYADIGLVKPLKILLQGIEIFLMMIWPNYNLLQKPGNLISAFKNVKSFFLYTQIKIGPVRK